MVFRKLIQLCQEKIRYQAVNWGQENTRFAGDLWEDQEILSWHGVDPIIGEENLL